MRIAIPVAQYHSGNPAEYMRNAFDALGHDAVVLSIEEFANELKLDNFDFYFCVDSSQGIDFSNLLASFAEKKAIAMWYIDYRHNKNRRERNPEDAVAAKALLDAGGFLYQAQNEDCIECRKNGLLEVEYLPLAADPKVWNAAPAEPKLYDLGFVGHIWDAQRGRVLEYLSKSKDFSFAFQGHGRLWHGEAAALLRRCKVGFNINSFFGSAYCFDVNMRFYETLCCGIPLLTNFVPAIEQMGLAESDFVRTYRGGEDLRRCVIDCLSDTKFLNAGMLGRQWVCDNATYMHRAKQVLQRFGDE